MKYFAVISLIWLNYRFNRLILFGMSEYLPTMGLRVSPTEQLPGPDTESTAAIIAKLYADCFFLHFAGCQQLMRHLGSIGEGV